MKRHVDAWLMATILIIGSGGTSQAQNASPSTSSTSAPNSLSTSDLLVSQSSPGTGAEYARLLDPSTPMEDRLKAFHAAEARAQSGSRKDMYVVGSLYRIGTQLPASPVARDLDKARLFLSNAATHGEILAMAKMAEIEAGARRPMEAMTWAQIYGHYAQLQPAPYRPSEGYLAELIDRASPGIAKSQLQDVVDHLNAFIAAYDAQVLDGSRKSQIIPGEDMSPRFIPKRSIDFNHGDGMPPAGFVDYCVAFGPDGSVTKILALDATPDFKLEARLHPIMGGYKVNPSAQGLPQRYAFIPAMFDDGKFRLAPKSGKTGAP